MTDTAAELLRDASRAIGSAVMEGRLTQGERAYLTATSTRLDALAAKLEEPEPEPEPALRRPEAFYTRREAAKLLHVAPNTLLNWEERGLLTPQRDSRGWRVYGREDLARAFAIAAHVPVAELPTGSRSR